MAISDVVSRKGKITQVGAKADRHCGKADGDQKKAQEGKTQTQDWTSKSTMMIWHSVTDSYPRSLYIYTIYCIRNEQQLSVQMTGSGDEFI